ncbi:MAG: hypothetical protein IE885_07940 [Campylobacterales bacterium]|nr:hypothetical protein [Campylobacterales bacterium]
MSNSLDKLKALTSRLEDKLAEKGKVPSAEPKPSVIPIEEPLATKPVSVVQSEFGNVRSVNMERLKNLYEKLGIAEKSPDFENIFIYKAMNLSGIGLKEDDFGEVREGKYVQIIAITYEPDKNGKKKAKNISLGYFGKAEILESSLKKKIIEFVLRWRYEKAFQNLEHYKDLIAKIEQPVDTLF